MQCRIDSTNRPMSESKKTKTTRSSVSLLWIVLVFLTQTLVILTTKEENIPPNYKQSTYPELQNSNMYCK